VKLGRGKSSEGGDAKWRDGTIGENYEKRERKTGQGEKGASKKCKKNMSRELRKNRARKT